MAKTKRTKTTTTTVRGSKHGRAVLNERAVQTMRRQVAKGTATIADMARKYDVNYVTAYNAVRGTTWTHVTI